MNLRKRHLTVVLVSLPIITLGLIFARLWWASFTPSRPKNMPSMSVWIWAPYAPLDLSPRGYWLGCWLDTLQNVNRCRVTDRKGNIKFENDYRSLTRQTPIPETELQIRPYVNTFELWTWSESMRVEIAVARLANGEVLVPVQAYGELLRRLSP